ncbi:hypothetical protein [Cognatishimia sp. MH4019]|uniref:hypothetical protein n=1 Tax=Cognatishimia sp. MH4019 TaxID=2854030 RepID=UPI001CD7E9C0|nr:hypothetical protein [Cognatishimia sp. MH4019]
MARTIFKIGGATGFLAARFQKGFFGTRELTTSEGETVRLPKHGSVRQIVSDGDTVNVSSDANFPIRFLGIDTPESSLISPQTGQFIATDSEIFQRLLADPFGSDFDAIEGLDPRLQAYLEDKAGPEAAETHKTYAEAAEDALEALILNDQSALQSEKFFLAFAYDALDGFGRLLAFVHPNQPDTPRAERLPSYNARLLETGLAAPYFIFPNVDPFRTRGSPVEAAAMAENPQIILDNAPSLRAAREALRASRDAERGVFDPAKPIGFEAFEFRFLARRSVPSRWVMDLSGDAARLIPPQRYFEIENLEDRLFVPSEFVPLFAAAGWEIEGDVMEMV